MLIVVVFPVEPKDRTALKISLRASFLSYYRHPRTFRGTGLKVPYADNTLRMRKLDLGVLWCCLPSGRSVIESVAIKD
jgi:hypothetical protein